MEHHSKTVLDETKITDPVCGMPISKRSGGLSNTYQGQTYYFCSDHCLEKFKAAPEHFSNQRKHAHKHEAAAPEPDHREEKIYTCPMHPEVRQNAPGDCPKCGMALKPLTPGVQGAGTQWTCPMHPEVVRDAPGNCPKCGMALEPIAAAADEEESGEYIYMRNRFWVGAALSLPLLLIAMRGMLGLGFLESLLGAGRLHWAEFVLATPVVLWGGWTFFVRAGKSVATRNLNMFTLIGLGTGVAYVYSVVAMVFPQIFPASFRSESGTVGVYFEAAAAMSFSSVSVVGNALRLRRADL